MITPVIEKITGEQLYLPLFAWSVNSESVNVQSVRANYALASAQVGDRGTVATIELNGIVFGSSIDVLNEKIDAILGFLSTESYVWIRFRDSETNSFYPRRLQAGVYSNKERTEEDKRSSKIVTLPITLPLLIPAWLRDTERVVTATTVAGQDYNIYLPYSGNVRGYPTYTLAATNLTELEMTLGDEVFSWEDGDTPAATLEINSMVGNVIVNNLFNGLPKVVDGSVFITLDKLPGTIVVNTDVATQFTITYRDMWRI